MKRIALVSLIFLACNPVKQVLKDPKKFEVVKEAVIRGGYCINDTVTMETTKDSIVYKVSIIDSLIPVPCKDFDTTLSDGTRIKVSSGVLKYTKSNKETIRTITRINNIRDRAYENILKSDIANRDSAIKAYMKLYEQTQNNLVSSKRENTKLKWKLWLVIALAVAWTFRRTILKLVKPL